MNNHESTRISYDRMSNWYDLFASGERRFTNAGLSALHIQPTDSVLEIGCGTGNALRYLEHKCQRMTGIDLSMGMLKKAKSQLELTSTRICLCQADTFALPFLASSFSTIFLSFTLELFSDDEIPHVLTECLRVLQPPGKVGVVSLARERKTAVKVYQWFHNHWPELIDCKPIESKEYLVTSGFKIAEESRMTYWGLPVDIVIAKPA